MQRNWEEQIFELQILEFLRVKGFSKVNEKALELFKDILIKKAQQIMLKGKTYAELNQRSEVNVFDILSILESDNSQITNMTERLETTQNKFENSTNLVKKVLQETTEIEDLNHKQYEEELELIQNIQKEKIQSKYPMCFIRNKKDVEKPLYVSIPDPVALKNTEHQDEKIIPNEEIKKERIQEMRSFELENCKVQGFEKEKQIIEEKVEKKPKILTEGNIFAQEEEIVEQIQTFEVSNTNLFQLINLYKLAENINGN